MQSSRLTRHLPGFDVVIAQAFNPSLHVCSNLGSPGSPHFRNHEPPMPQQVSPSLSSTHLGHAGMWTMFRIVEISLLSIVIKRARIHAKKDANMLPDTIGFGFVGFGVVSFIGLCVDIVILHAFTPSLQVCSNFGSLLRPHFLNHDPPLPQQVSDPLIWPHLGHADK